MTANTYLRFNGNCEEAMTYYADVLGGKLTEKMRFNEAPEADLQFPEEAMNLIMHASLSVSDVKIMASDSVGQPFSQGNNFSISLSTNDEDEAYTIFSGLSEGGEVQMPFGEAFWGGKFGMCVDKFGVSWMLSCSDNSAV